MSFVSHSWFLTVRVLRHLMRQPWYIALTLIQPIIWLVLYGQLFKRVVELPGFQTNSYISFLTPGVIIMSALFGAGWSGMGVILDLDHGVMDRFLIAPVSRPAIIVGRLSYLAIVTVVQSLILFSMGFVLGARYPGGAVGLFVLLIAAISLSLPFGALSIALALLVRKQESVIGAVNFILLPLTFMSPVFIASPLMPTWMTVAARFNPLNWAVQAGRLALASNTDWSVIVLRLLWLWAFALFSMWLATRAFRAYQRSA
jgi:ABC-2 type transport system permease protein